MLPPDSGNSTRASHGALRSASSTSFASLSSAAESTRHNETSKPNCAHQAREACGQLIISKRREEFELTAIAAAAAADGDGRVVGLGPVVGRDAERAEEKLAEHRHPRVVVQRDGRSWGQQEHHDLQPDRTYMSSHASNLTYACVSAGSSSYRIPVPRSSCIYKWWFV
jgi:hypothetical protein